jgi:uncharacterized membrane protein
MARSGPPAPGRGALWLGISYPVAAHLAILSGRPAFIAASVGLLVIIVLLGPLRRRSPWALGALVAAAFALYRLSTSEAANLPLFVPPVAINVFLAWVFGHTLRRGEMSQIERIVRALHPPGDVLSPEILAYARNLTRAWTGFFIMLAVVNLVLALCATPKGLLLAIGISPPVAVPLDFWSLFANLLNYLLVGGMFVLEYAIRRRKFPKQSYRNIVDFILQMSRLGSAAWRSDLSKDRGAG